MHACPIPRARHPGGIRPNGSFATTVPAFTRKAGRARAAGLAGRGGESLDFTGSLVGALGDRVAVADAAY